MAALGNDHRPGGSPLRMAPSTTARSSYAFFTGLPALELVYALLGQGNSALAVVYADNNSLDLVANVDD